MTARAGEGLLARAWRAARARLGWSGSAAAGPEAEPAGPPESPFALDRRVQIYFPNGQPGPMQRLSELREAPFLVLLGEPGMGKSTVLEAEAAREGRVPIPVRALMNGAEPADTTALFLDGLDEYRMDGARADKVHQLAVAIAKLAPTRWRIACRAEDWRKQADLAAMAEAAPDEAICIAQLLPLTSDEQRAILANLGESDPAAFVAEAERRSAGPLLENPLSLKLLRTAVAAHGEWPLGRYALYETATAKLAFEHNALRQSGGERTPANAILAAAEQADLLLLASGARALWRSAGPPPADGDARALVPATLIGVPPAVVGHILDTPLFSGEGDRFEPMHRTIAEFLGGRALARTVVGDATKAALPLSRAAALITAPDGKPPTEMRGLYAWFAAHLARLGADAAARALVERDAVSCLVYGDAAVFDLPTRRAMLANLDRDDPYFLGFEIGVTALGALASDDLADELIAALQQPEDPTHRFATVLEILSQGPRVAAVQPVLLAILLDPAKRRWHRAQALTAWLRAEGDTDARRRELFDALGATPLTIDREMLRASLLTGMSEAGLDDTDILQVLHDYAIAPGDTNIGGLHGLRRRLGDGPRLSLLDAPRTDWEAATSKPRSTIEVDQLLDHLFIRGVQRAPDLDAARLWRWILNASEGEPGELAVRSREAVAEWVSADPARPLALFEAIVDAHPDQAGLETDYMWVAGELPPPNLVRDLMRLADRERDGARRGGLVRSVVDTLRRNPGQRDLFEEVHAWLAARPADAAALVQLTTSELSDQHGKSAARRSARRARGEEQRASWEETYRRDIDTIRSGANDAALYNFVSPYFVAPDGAADPKDGRALLAAYVGDEIADAAMEGFECAALQPPVVTAFDLGEMHGEGGTFHWAGAALVGVVRLLERDPAQLDPVSPITALAVYNLSGHAHNVERIQAVERWAARQLDRDPVAGAGAIVDQWEGVLKTDDKTESILWTLPHDLKSETALPMALEAMLKKRPNLPLYPLNLLVTAAARRLPTSVLDGLSRAALARKSLPGQARALWSVVRFALAGDSERSLLHGHKAKTIVELLEAAMGDSLLEAVPIPDTANAAARHAAVIRILGALSRPEDSEPRGGRVLRRTQLSDPVLRSLGAIAANPDPAVAKLLTECLGNPALAAWHPRLRHALEEHRRGWRDAYHQPSTAAAIEAALRGAEPANAADLRAIAVDELGRLGRELQTDAASLWRQYWNTDQWSRATTPKTENVSRDTTLALVRERLVKYKLATVMPEAQHVNETRADLLLVSGVGRTLPIEAKRHYHADLWGAAAGQLQGYAAADGADGNGVLLVFWFGTEVADTPTRPDGRRPASAGDLKEMLVADLPEALRGQTDVIVLDVSAPPDKRADKGKKS